MRMRLDRKNKRITDAYKPTKLAERTRLSRGTIYNSMDRLTKAGWYKEKGGKPNAIVSRTIKQKGWVNITREMLECKTLRSRDIVMYGRLKAKDLHRKLGGQLTYRILSNCVGVCVKTARRAILALSNTNWLSTHRERKSQMAPINYALEISSVKYTREQIALTNMRLNRKGGHGEAIALALVMLVAEPTECQVGSRFSSLPSPESGEMMEVDIWLPEYRLAVEFQGEQHYNPTPFASAEDVAKQKRRDATKAALLNDQKINLVELTAADLSVTAVLNKLQGLVPLRDLRFYKRLVKYLNDVGIAYQQKAQTDANATRVLKG